MDSELEKALTFSRVKCGRIAYFSGVTGEKDIVASLDDSGVLLGPSGVQTGGKLATHGVELQKTGDQGGWETTMFISPPKLSAMKVALNEGEGEVEFAQSNGKRVLRVRI